MKLAVAVLCLLAACNPVKNPGIGDDGDDAMPGDAPRADTALPDGWQSLLEGDWNLAPGDEAYFCVFVTVPRDLDIKAFRPIGPPGTHHTVLTRYTSTSPADGTMRCSVATNGPTMIYGSGVGAPDFAFPPGVGLHLAKGQRLVLNLHLYNATDKPLTGRSGTLFQEAMPGELQHLAELVLAGPTIGLNVPVGVSTQSGNCTLSNVTNEPLQLFALSQHMHKLGKHMKSVINRNGAQIVLQDIDYDFEKQSFHLVSPAVELRPGDTLTTSCTFNNTTTGTVRFGESSDDEMCFTDLFYYPVKNASYICTN